MLVDEALRSGLVVGEVIVTAVEAAGARARDLGQASVDIVESSVMDALSTLSTAPGVVATVALPPTSLDLDTAGLVLAAVNIADPGNLGTLMRSAEAAGFDGIVVIEPSVDPFSPKVVRASAGAAFRLGLSEADDISVMRVAGLRLIALTSDAASHSAELRDGPKTRTVESLYEIPLGGRLALLVGNEAHGLSEELDVETWATIPHLGPAESLNAAMAGTVACMHVAERRQRNASGTDVARG